ncbi:response regulator [Patescibacteria group bacterium]|nr:response regulator [Patescibacteria group bacterium]MBU1673474.1 response regulator [Patescibacteria group bacterium]MBU1963995.1 response regulator [Patescibacteria group bacterium]
MLRGKDGLVIYFEDDKMLGKMYTIKLEKAGLSVLWEKHPTEKIISSLAEIRPDLIIMDIIMPVMDGWEATRRLKADERTKDIPVFGLSNMGAKENQEKACGLGMADYWLRAEHTPQEVADKVMELLKKK